MKGSYYANPLLDDPCSSSSSSSDNSEDLVRRYPEYLRPNIWPREALPALEPAFKDLGQLVVHVGQLLTAHCDQYVTSRNPGGTTPGRLEAVLERSKNHKARLLHYFPASPPPLSSGLVMAMPAAAEAVEQCREPSELAANTASLACPSLTGASPHGVPTCSSESDGSLAWCGWHLDHGSLTGLTSAVFTRDGIEVSNPDPAAGLVSST